jgi:hypothetical protein
MLPNRGSARIHFDFGARLLSPEPALETKYGIV